jgi:hypothetical protein
MIVITSVAVAWSTDDPVCVPLYLPNQPGLDFNGVWGTGDTGVITDRFIQMLNPTGGLVPVMHGVDLSMYNVKLNYRRLALCGTQFSFVRMDRAFKTHVQSLSGQGIYFIPTFDFQRASKYRLPSTYLPFSGKPDSVLEGSALMKDARLHGRALAKEFLDMISATGLNEVSTFRLENDSVKFFAIDVEELNNGINNAGLNRQFGIIYAATIVAFVTEIQEKHPDMVPILYLFPNVYWNYLRFSTSEDDRALSTYSAWVARNRPRAADVYMPMSTDAIDKYMQRFCRVGGGDRCIFQQYTHRALIGYGVAIPSQGAVPLHHDLDRMFPIKTCHIGSRKVLVRDDVERSDCM